MSKYEQFVVKKVSENRYRNSAWNVEGSAEEVKAYAEKNGYGDGVVVYVGRGNGDKLVSYDASYVRL